MKNYHLQSALDFIRPLIQKGAKVLPLLNGVEHIELLRHEFGEEAVLGGLCQIIVTLDAQGALIHSNQLHDITFGPFHESQADFCRVLAEQTKDANMRMQVSENINVDMWWKYAFITAFSGVTTASRLPINEILQAEAAKHVFKQGLQEMRQLAASQGVELPEGFVDKIMENVSRMPDGSTSSMHQDLRKELSLEVESLQGAAVRIARQAGVEIPTIKTLYGLIKPFERL
jgi:2-dehydropantoate 2-reductase